MSPLIALLPAALAADVSLSTGLVRSPAADTAAVKGLRYGVEIRPIPWLGVGASGARYQDDAWEGVVQNSEHTRWARLDSRKHVEMALYLPALEVAEGSIGALEAEIGAFGGYGVARVTSDDLVDWTIDAHTSELRPSAAAGLTGGLRLGHAGVRVRAERQRYSVRFFDGSELGFKSTWITAELVGWLTPLSAE